MEYTKDVVLELGRERQVGIKKGKNWTGYMKKEIKENKLVILTVILLSSLMLIDIFLVNAFLQLFSRVY